MLTNYIKIAFRSFTKFRAYAVINLTGLALGLTAGIMMLLYVIDELSYDQFHAKTERIYRVETQFVDRTTGDAGNSYDANGWPVGVILRKDYPEVEAAMYSRSASFLTINHEGKRIKQNSHFVSEEFFNIFSFELIKGNPENALSDPYTVVISESMEKKYFDGHDALNKSITMADTLEFLVTGVMKDIPANSHIQADVLISFNTYTALNPSFDYNDGWGNINVRNYVLLKEGVNAGAFAAKAKNIYMQHAGQMFNEWGSQANVVFSPLTDLYLTGKINGMGPIGSLDRKYLITGIVGFVILLACINFINLTTARSIYRAKEVGLRKVVGSSRQGLIKQFLSESFVLTMVALFIGIALTGLLLPIFNQLMSKNYGLSSLGSPFVVLGMVGLVLMVTLLSGYYPAMIMSGMRPVEVLKGKMQSSSRGTNLRRSLVIFQFVISVTLVLGTLIVLDQLNYMQKQELGFAKDEIFVINAARVNSKNPNAFETFKNELKRLSLVENVSYSNSLPGNPGWSGQVAYPEGKSGDEAISVEYIAIDEDYLDALGLDIIAGRGFSKDHETELKDGLILNETAVSDFGWASPEDAIGKKITSPSGYPAGEVIGVVKDYHQFGLQQHVGPMTMDFNPGNSYLYAIRYKAANTQELIKSVSVLWNKSFPGYDFNYFFLDHDFERQYQSEQRLAQVFGVFAVITIIIAVIGLLGLVSFMVVAKTKEIGVRKVLGAGVFSITQLLTKEFIVLVIVANCIACPVAWYFSSQWLESFANRVDVNPLLFVLTLFIALMITIITISFQTVRAAMADPVKSLRYE